MGVEVTDPALLKQLEGGPAEVTDPNLIAQLEGQGGRYGSGASFDATSQGLVPSGSPEALRARSPVALPDPNSARPVGSEIGAMIHNIPAAAGMMYTNLYQGLRQRLGLASTQDVADKRALDAPLRQGPGGSVGQIVAGAPLALLPSTYPVAIGSGALMGALQPTGEGESALANTVTGAALGAGGKFVGDTASNWLEGRAAQPFLGWNQRTGNQAAAQAVGVDAPALTQPAIKQASDRFDEIFGAARNPNVSIPVADSTLTALEQAGNTVNSSSRAALYANDQVKDLIGHLGAEPTAEQLGAISSNLGKDAAAEMSAKMGDRALGRALYSVKEHVDDLIGSSITDPALAEAYAAARPQYRNFMTMTNRPTILNSATGDVNLRNLGNYLQKYDKTGYLKGQNTSPLYEAARFGQASTIGSRPPPPILQPVKFAAYHAINNPLVGATTGTISRLGAPLAPAIRAGLPGLSVASEPALLAYFDE